MTNIQEAGKTAAEFLKNALNVCEMRVIAVTKTDDGWDAEVEVYEESSFMKSLGLPSRVQDRNIYTVKMSNSLDVESYERQGHVASVS